MGEIEKTDFEQVNMHRFLLLIITASLLQLLFPFLNGDTYLFCQDSLVRVDSVPHDTTAEMQDTVQSDSSTMGSANDSGNQADTVIINKEYPQRAAQPVKHDVRQILRTIFRYIRHVVVLIICCGIILYTISFYRKKADTKRFLTSTRLSVMNKEVQIACNYMEKYFENPDLSVESICKALVTGPAFLEALFERELGMSVSDFLLQVRINRAKKILEKRPLEPADEISLQVGFTDSKLFIKRFKEITGLSFEEYQSSLDPKV